MTTNEEAVSLALQMICDYDSFPASFKHFQTCYFPNLPVGWTQLSEKYLGLDLGLSRFMGLSPDPGLIRPDPAKSRADKLGLDNFWRVDVNKIILILPKTFPNGEHCQLKLIKEDFSKVIWILKGLLK